MCDWSVVMGGITRPSGMASGRQRAASERGAALVEFAIVLPLLLILLFGVIDFGFLINRNTMINNAAREGGREAMFGSDVSTIEARIRDAAAILDQDRLTVTITCTTPDRLPCPGAYDDNWAAGGSVLVQVDYEYRYITPVADMFGIGPPTLSSTVEMRIEG